MESSKPPQQIHLLFIVHQEDHSRVRDFKIIKQSVVQTFHLRGSEQNQYSANLILCLWVELHGFPHFGLHGAEEVNW
jgi:hypothetical protein